MGLTKQDLQEYRWLVESIESLENEIESLRDRIDISSQIISDMPKSHRDGDKMATTIALIIDTQDLLLDKVAQAMAKRREVESAIEKLPEREKVLIRQRYIEGKAWEQICVNMSYSFQRLHQLHSKALVSISHAKV